MSAPFHLAQERPADAPVVDGLVARAFTPRRIETLRATAQTIAGELIDSLLARAATGPVDLIEAFAHPFPMRVICSLLGVPEADRPLAPRDGARRLAQVARVLALRAAAEGAARSARLLLLATDGQVLLAARVGDVAARVALLEGTARLFTQNVRLSVYPMTEAALKARLQELGANAWSYQVTDGLVYVDSLHPPEPVHFLFRYLLACEFIVSARPAVT